MNQDLYFLEDLFIRLQGSHITDYSYSNSILRFQLQTAVAALLLPGSYAMHLVLEGCYRIYFFSYNQDQENRKSLDNPSQIFVKGLIIQGIELRNRQNSINQNKEDFILYCNSYRNTIEAGELHLNAHGFQLYDQEFGKVSYKAFCKASDQLKTAF